jgi:hypothetical protein
VLSAECEVPSGVGSGQCLVVAEVVNPG